MIDSKTIVKNLRGIGAIVFPSDLFGDKIHPYVKWIPFQTRYPNDDEIKEHDGLFERCKYYQIMCGILYDLTGKPTEHTIVGYDLDNKPAVNEFCYWNGKQHTIEELANISGFLVDKNPNKPNSYHVYIITRGQVRYRKLVPPDGKKDENIPMIEVLPNSDHLITIREFIGNYNQFFNNLTAINTKDLEEHIDRIEQKHWNIYYPNGNKNNDPTRILIDTVDGIAYEGIRNPALHAYACHKLRLLYDTTTPEEIKKDVEDTNQKRCVPALPKREVNTIWKSALDFISKQIELETVNGNANGKNGNKTNDEKYDELKGNIYYRINVRPTKYVIAHRQSCTVIEVEEKYIKNSFLYNAYLRHSKTFFACIPVKITRHKNPLTFLQLQETFTIQFIDATKEYYTFSHKTLAAIIQSLKERALVLGDGADSALSSIIQGFKQRNLIEINEELGFTGFFKVGDKILASNLEIKEPSSYIDKLTDALAFIEELKICYENRLDLLATSIVWGMIAPAIFMLKTNNYFLKGLNFYGFSNATKSNTGKIILAIDGNHEDHNNHALNFNMVDTTAKLGAAVSRSTFPILIDEVDLNDIKNSQLVNMIKIIIESIKARDKFMLSKDWDPSSIPALSCLILTSNLPPPFHNSGLMRRLISRPFPQSETWKENDPKAIEFKEFLRVNLSRLKALGDFRNWYIMSHQSEILDEKRPDPLDLGLNILKGTFQYAGIEIPNWLLHERIPENQLEESMEDNDVIVKRAFEKYIDEQFNRALQFWRQGLDKDEKLVLPNDITGRLVKLAEDNLLPDIKYAPRKFGVFIGAGILKELYSHGVTGDQIPNLKALADYLEADYKKSDGKKVVFADKHQLTKYFDAKNE